MSDNIEFVEQWKLADMEKDFLSACLLDSTQTRRMWVNLYQHIDKSYFENKLLGDIFVIYSKFFDKYKAFPSESRMISMLQALNYKKDEDLNCARSIYQKDTFKAGELDALEDDIKLFVKNNKIKNAVFKAIKLIKTGEYPLIETNIREAIAWNSEVDLGMEIGVEGVKARYAKIDDYYSSYIRSPWSRLNEYIGGGFFKKQLALVASSSSVGKSIFLDQVAAHAWLYQNKNVVLFTFEMSDLVKSLRIDSYLTGLEIKDIRANQDDVFRFYETTGPKKNKLIVKEYPTSGASVADFRTYLYHLELYKGIKVEDIDAVITDYSDIMKSEKDYRGNKYLEDKDINEGLRGFAQNYDVAGISATQFGRSAAECTLDELNEAKLADSFWKMRSADVMVALWNTPELREAGEIWFKLIKNRNGAKDKSWQMFVDYATLTIKEE